MLYSLKVIAACRKIYSGPMKFVKKKRTSFLNFFEHFSFSQSKKDKYPTIYDKEEQAIIAYCTLKYIKQTEKTQLLTDSRSLRQKIFNLEHLTKYILSKAQSYEKMKNSSKQSEQNKLQQNKQNSSNHLLSNLIKLSRAGFSQQNIEAVIKGYNIQDGASINLQVWKQSRFIDSLSSNGKILLLPNLGTGLIIQKIDEEIDKIIISGDKGSGKSFAFFNYAYLSDIIIDYRLSLIENQSKPSNKFLHFVKLEEFVKVKKLFYFPLKYVDSIRTLQDIFQKQTHLPNAYKLNGSQLSSEDQIQNLREFIWTIKKYYSNYSIKTVCIADQSNAYLSAFRSIMHNKFLHNNLVRNYSNIFKCVENIFDLFIYNSSQAVQAQWVHQRIQQIRDSSKIKYHDPYEHNKLTYKNLQIYYSQYLSTKQGNIYIYSLLWDELCKQLTQYNLQSNKIARFVFEKCFGLPSSFKQILLSNNIQQLSSLFQWWNIDVRPLNINIVCSNKNNLTLIRKGLIRLSKQLNKQNIQKATLSLLLGFRSISSLIQQNCQQICISKIKGYYQKSQNDKIKSFRFALVQKLAQIKNKMKVVIDQSPTIIVDYEKLLSSFQNHNSYQSYIQQVDNICELLGTGYPFLQDQQQIDQTNIEQVKQFIKNKNKNPQIDQKRLKLSKKKFKFLLTPSCLASITAQASASLEEVLMLARNLTSGGAIEPILAGLIMDMLYYHIFQSSSLKLYIKELYGVEKKEYNISKTFPFHVQTTLNLKLQLKNLFEYAHKFKGKYVLGFQTSILTDQQRKIHKLDYRINTRNPIFDFIIIKEEQNQLYINSFDATVGSIQSKVNDFRQQKHYNQLLRQIESIFEEYHKKVIWEHQILGIEERIKLFNKINHRTAHSLMFKKRLQNHALMYFEGMERIQSFIGTLKLGICSADSQQHFKLPSNEQTREKSINAEMKDIIQKVIGINEDNEQQ